jgi:hypothetical protein
MTHPYSVPKRGEIDDCAREACFLGSEGEQVTFDRLLRAREDIRALTADGADESADETEIATTVSAEWWAESDRFAVAGRVVNDDDLAP